MPPRTTDPRSDHSEVIRLDAVIGRSLAVPVPSPPLSGATQYIAVEAAIDHGEGEPRFVTLSGSLEGRVGPPTLSIRPRKEGHSRVVFRFVDARSGREVADRERVTYDIEAKAPVRSASTTSPSGAAGLAPPPMRGRGSFDR